MLAAGSGAKKEVKKIEYPEGRSEARGKFTTVICNPGPLDPKLLIKCVGGRRGSCFDPHCVVMVHYGAFVGVVY